MMKKRKSICLVLIVTGAGILLFFLRPPGEPRFSAGPLQEGTPEIPYLNAGSLPGITWADDIHPVFLRNNCAACHTRGREAKVEGLTGYSLGLIDPRQAANPFYSYHELVYAEGVPLVREGEVFRDGQCCWPKDFPPDQQRRIWLGHPERSALLRKLEQDYFDWNRPPRFLEEGLRLSWGMPMPMFHREDPQEKTASGAHQPSDRPGHHPGLPGPEGDMEHGHGSSHVYRVLPFWSRIVRNAGLWLGRGRDGLNALPPRIPARDRQMVRYWIQHAMQLAKEGTGIEVSLLNGRGLPAAGRNILLVGNVNPPEQDEVKDTISLVTDAEGVARVLFPKGSVVTRFWAVLTDSATAVPSAGPVFSIHPGKISKHTLRLE